ncbi:hypothetical protein ABW19_dt0205135 [Dactylella cylindrospora]|nr:hypothetical protein ABW19_dt0205135 [Dactylella cylindrospora]
MDPTRTNGVPPPFPYGNPNGASQADPNYGIQFNDPWKAGGNPTSAPYVGMASTSLASQNDMSALKQPSIRQNSVSSSFEQLALAMPSSRSLSSQTIYQTDFLPGSGFPTTYAEQQPTTSPTARATNYTINGYGSYDQNPNKNLYSLLSSLSEDRRLSHPSIASAASSSSIMDSPLDAIRQRHSSLVDYSRPQVTGGTYHTADTIDSARGMLALNQNATRFPMPHNGHRTSSSASSGSYYPQSTSSSISSASSYPYYSGSMETNGTDMTSLSADMYDAARPNLPRPMGLIQSQMLNHQSGQASMMGQFNSRVQSNTTKKHKCKVCDKRFTRPSSLQTHMYSHTGEKPFACEVEGCGRQFSVVSNLRRHRKVHKGHSDTETVSNAGSV